MRARNALRQLSEIVAVRRIQEGAAQMKASEAGRVLADATTLKNDEHSRLTELHASWRRSVEAAVVSPDLVGAWASAVRTSVAHLEQREQEVARADSDLIQRSKQWKMTQAQTEIAQQLEAAAARRLRNERDERALSEMADRTARGATLS